MMTKTVVTTVTVVLAGLFAATLPVAGQEGPVASEERLFVREQRTYTPGYPVGNIAIGDPAVADFKVVPGRRELILFGVGEGVTTLTIWDQQNVKRSEIEIAVVTRESVQLEEDLREMLADFPNVTVRKLGGNLVISGTVARQSDFDAVQAIADAASVQNVVRVVSSRAPATTPGTGGEAQWKEMREGGAGTPADPDAPPAPTVVEYEVELLEAAIQFGSGSYGTGVEPSGRRLYAGKLSVTANKEGTLFIGGPQMFPKETAEANKKRGRRAQPDAPETGFRLTFRPVEPGEDGVLLTNLLVETNMPYDLKVYDPDVWRRARWEIGAASGEPVGVAGAELMAMPDIAARGSALGRATGAASTAAGLPGIGGLPGTEYATAGSVVYYDRSKKTQLLLIVRPTFTVPEAEW
ncbi:MAG: pilus assembly protein N-terminal domain-containing protein [Acidobacteria bacterium]|nr:pilus assembly protein N-terminal domain-containing protein [Acidobacteriota bacterium]